MDLITVVLSIMCGVNPFKDYEISDGYYPCQEHNGEHLVRQAQGMSRDGSRHVSLSHEHGSKRLEVVVSERTDTGWHSESKSGTVDDLRDWMRLHD